MMEKFTVAPPECQLHRHCGGYCESERGRKYEFCEKCLIVHDQHWGRAKGEMLTFGYTNYRGEFAQRRATPIRFEFCATEHHTDLQWIMIAVDHDKGELREFALQDMVLKSPVEPVTSLCDVREIRKRFPSATMEVVNRIAELEQMVADLVVIKADIDPAQLDFAGRFKNWDENVRKKKPPYSTINMKTERKEAFTAGMMVGFGCRPGSENNGGV